jgi:hypothetical protein
MQDVPQKPRLKQLHAESVSVWHPVLGNYVFEAEGAEKLLFTENESNLARLFGVPNQTTYVKDAFHRYLVDGELTAVNPALEGTKVAALYRFELSAGQTSTIRLRLSKQDTAESFGEDLFGNHFDAIFEQRQKEADEFYRAIQEPGLQHDARRVQRQALAGMLWTKQLYYLDVAQWLDGDPGLPPPPRSRRHGRNSEWLHLNNFDVISMPDKWEYPWYAAWDLGFHCVSLVLVDPDFAKQQLQLMTREWYMHPNGQLPAYEWAFGDVNPPVHAWAAWRVYKIDAKQRGRADTAFLKSIFHKLLLNFTWWVNRKDREGRNIFQGGFLGLDNISLFDRSAMLPAGGHLDQADGTAWMGFFSLLMLKISLELAKDDPIYQDMATKFYEHFLAIARAMTDTGGQGYSLWNDEDGFFYDALHLPQSSIVPLRVRSLVGLMPLLAVETLEPQLLEMMPDFERRLRWYTKHRPHLSGNMASVEVPGLGRRRLVSIVTRERLVSVLRYMLDETEFLSPHGIRSLSKRYEAHPYSLTLDGKTYSIDYQPAESRSSLFGGNSNWRGPVWFPINFLLIEALQRFHHYYGDDLQVEFPSGSGQMLSLWDVSVELSHRLIRLFLRDKNGRRPIYGGLGIFQEDPYWRDHLLFHEYFHGDNGAGLGASHQTGWTGLVAKLIQQSGTGM